MKLWPFGKPETRADQDYTDVVVRSLIAAATGDVAAGLTAGVEIASGQWGRAFSSAEITPGGIMADIFKPHLGLIGRELVKNGQAVFELSVEGERVSLIPASTVSVTGGPDPSTWRYELTLAGPSGSVTRHLPADRVLHLFYAKSAAKPWRGISPIEASGTTKKLLDNLEKRLAQETGEAVGHLLPVPNVESTGQLQDDIRGLKGQVTLVETTAEAWGAGTTGSPRKDYGLTRVGADPPDALRGLRREAEQSILAACGVPVSVLGGGQGTASREAYRQFLHLTIAPVALALSGQVEDVTGLPFALSFDRLMASDLSGRARAMQSMVNGGLAVERAAGLAGLMEPEE